MRTEHDDELDNAAEEGQAPLPGGPDGEGLTVSEAAEILDLTPPEVRRLIRAGRLPARRFAGILGAEYRLDRADVERARGMHPGADDAAGLAAQRPRGRVGSATPGDSRVASGSGRRGAPPERSSERGSRRRPAGAD